MSTDYQDEAIEYVRRRYHFDEDTQQFGDMVDRVRGELAGEDGQQEIGDSISDLREAGQGATRFVPPIHSQWVNKEAVVGVAALALVGGVAAFKIIRRAWNRRARKPKK